MSADLKILFPEPLKNMVGAESSIMVKADTIREAILSLIQMYPGMRDLFMGRNGNFHWGGIILYLNNMMVDIAHGNIDTSLYDGDELAILMPISGG